MRFHLAKLFEVLKIRDLIIKNRIFMSPMCQYSAIDGLPNDWHFVHYGSHAIGGAGLIIIEATSVNPEGRISSQDLGIWNEEQMLAFKKINTFIKSQGSATGLQIAHAGRKASSRAPWQIAPHKDWITKAPSALPFNEKSTKPVEMTLQDINDVIQAFEQATLYCREADFDVIEIHMAHGYLLHEFLSPYSNQRTDSYGGSIENRMRLPLQIADTVRKAWPQTKPVFVRISATDWIEPQGWTIADSIVFSQKLKDLGIDFIDCSTGGNVANAQIPVEKNYQVEFAHAIKQKVQIMTGAVGLITEAEQANQILTANQADAVLLGRELLRNPNWPLIASQKLKVDFQWPNQYMRAKIL